MYRLGKVSEVMLTKNQPQKMILVKLYIATQG